jgi:hypothetical protein
VTPRSRIAAFGSAAALVLAGVACAVLVGGVAGEVLTIVLIAAGLAGALLLVFLEIGLGEERDLAREQQRKRRRLGGVFNARRRLRPRQRRPE